MIQGLLECRSQRCLKHLCLASDWGSRASWNSDLKGASSTFALIRIGGLYILRSNGSRASWNSDLKGASSTFALLRIGVYIFYDLMIQGLLEFLSQRCLKHLCFIRSNGSRASSTFVFASDWGLYILRSNDPGPPGISISKVPQAPLLYTI